MKELQRTDPIVSRFQTKVDGPARMKPLTKTPNQSPEPTRLNARHGDVAQVPRGSS